MKGWWRELADAVEAGRIELVTSPQAIEEFVDVTTRPEKQRLLDLADASEIADLLRRTTLLRPDVIPQVCRDPNDDYLLALAAASHADVLVTRDEDLLTLGSYGRTEIIHVARFLTRIATRTRD